MTDTDYPDNKHDVFQELVEQAEDTDASGSEYSTEPEAPDLEWAYGSLQNGVRNVVRGYAKLLMLDAPGGIGKTYQIKQVLRDELGPEGENTGSYKQDRFGWLYKAGYTTPLALFESLWEARHGDILFLDDMSGITKKDKCVEMLKAATDTEGPENIITYESSNPPELGPMDRKVEQFNFEGKVIMSFNDTPDNKHFDALEDRAWLGSIYELDFTHEERIQLLRDIAKDDSISSLPYEKRAATVDWIENISDASMNISIRTLRGILKAREACEKESDISGWKRDALAVFDLDYEKHLIVSMRNEMAMPIEEQIEVFKEKTGRSRGYYYDLWSRIRTEKS